MRQPLDDVSHQHTLSQGHGHGPPHARTAVLRQVPDKRVSSGRGLRSYRVRKWIFDDGRRVPVQSANASARHNVRWAAELPPAPR